VKRRKLLTLLVAGGATWPPFLATAAGDPAKFLRLGIIAPLPPGPGIQVFVEQLRVLGWEEGRNLHIEFVQVDSTDTDRALAMAAELVDRGVDVIYAGGPEVVLKSAVAATQTVPIVMLAIDYDPIAHGYVASLARPGGNVTGVSWQQIELTGKRLDILSQTVPGLARFVVLWDAISADQFEAAQGAARSLKISLDGIEFDRRAGPAGAYWQLSRVGFGVGPPGDAAGSVGLWLCDRGVFEPQAGASDVRFGSVSLHRSQ